MVHVFSEASQTNTTEPFGDLFNLWVKSHGSKLARSWFLPATKLSGESVTERTVLGGAVILIDGHDMVFLIVADKPL